jgi:hypothetical protein
MSRQFRPQRVPDKPEEVGLHESTHTAFGAFIFHSGHDWSESTSRNGGYPNLRDLSSTGFTSEMLAGHKLYTSNGSRSVTLWVKSISRNRPSGWDTER